jgi:hypothetical protein
MAEMTEMAEMTAIDRMGEWGNVAGGRVFPHLPCATKSLPMGECAEWIAVSAIWLR